LKYLKILRKILITFISSIFILICILLGILYHKPVDLNFLIPKLQKALDLETNGVINIDNANLTWKGIGHPLEIKIRNAVVEKNQDDNIHLTLPELDISFRLSSLLILNLQPKAISVTKPTLIIKQNEKHHTVLTNAENSFDLFADLPKLMRHPSARNPLKSLIIKDAQVSFQSPLLGHGKIKRSTIHFERRKAGLAGKAQLVTEKGARLDIEFLYDRTNERIDFKWNIGQLHFGDFKPLLSHWITDQAVLNQLLQLDFCLKGKGEGVYSTHSGFQSGEGHFECPYFSGNPGGFMPQDLKASNGHLKIVFADQKILIKECALPIEGLPIRFDGKIIPDQHWEKFDLQLNATLSNFQFNDLGKYWPKDIIPNVRSWLCENIKNASVPKATYHMDATLMRKAKEPVFHLNGLKGTIHLDHAEIRYYSTMPIITNVNAVAHYTENGFDINVSSGSIQDVYLTNSQVLIGPFLEKNKDTKLTIHSDINGPISTILDTLDYEPLQYACKAHITPSACCGTAQGHLDMTIPLSGNTSQGIQFKATTKLENAGFGYELGKKVIRLQQGNGNLTVDNNGLDIQADATFEKNMLSLHYQNHFNDQEIPQTLDIKGMLDAKALAALGLDLTRYIQGNCPTEIHYTQDNKEHEHFSIDADLTPLAITYGEWKKSNETSARLKGHFSIDHGHIQAMDKLEVTGPDQLLIEATSIPATNETFITSLKIPVLKVGNTHLSAHCEKRKNGGTILYVQGDSLDISPLLKSSNKSTEFSIDDPIEIRARIKKIKINPQHTLHSNGLNALMEGSIIKTLSYKGTLDPENPDSRVLVSITPKPSDTREFRIITEDTGLALNAFDLAENVHNGYLKIVALHDDKSTQNPWIGKVKFKNFALKKAPILSRFIAGVFPAGLTDLTSEGGLKFNYLKMKFEYKHDLIDIKSGRAYGNSLGFSWRGQLRNGPLSTVNIKGTVLPIYFVNTLFSKIPLIGELISGGKHEGIWGVSFSIDGPTKEPNIQINPLSVFTPGFLRKIFTPSPDDDDDDTFEEDPL